MPPLSLQFKVDISKVEFGSLNQGQVFFSLTSIPFLIFVTVGSLVHTRINNQLNPENSKHQRASLACTGSRLDGRNRRKSNSSA